MYLWHKIKSDQQQERIDMMEDFKKCTFGEFLNLPELERKEYERIGLLLKPDSWQVSDVMDWPYITVKDIQRTFSHDPDYEEVINIITELTGQRKDKILSKIWINVFRFLKFVINSIEGVNKLEQKLAYEPDADEERAGIEMFNEFGYFVTIDRLAGGDPLKHEAVGQLPYSQVFAKLRLNQVDNIFMKNYQKVITSKK